MVKTTLVLSGQQGAAREVASSDAPRAGGGGWVLRFARRRRRLACASRQRLVWNCAGEAAALWRVPGPNESRCAPSGRSNSPVGNWAATSQFPSWLANCRSIPARSTSARRQWGFAPSSFGQPVDETSSRLSGAIAAHHAAKQFLPTQRACSIVRQPGQSRWQERFVK